MSTDNEYKEIFLAEALENHEELNRLLTQLEKEPDNKKFVDAIFRITHTLKGNAAGMGFKNVAEFAHVMEDLFGEVREENLSLDEELFSNLFKATDVLGELINAIKDGKTIRFRGIKTKLEVQLKSVRKEGSPQSATPAKSAPDDPVVEQVDSASDEAPEEEAATDARITFSDLVQVPVRKLDNLLNLVGELIIERDRMVAANTDKVHTNEYARLNRVSSDLQYSVMDVRLVQVGFLFNKFHRVVRDAANLEGKKVSLTLKGTETEIDRNMLQIISDSLIHLIRNAVSHGLEAPAARRKAGKSEEGNVTLSAFSESDAVFIEITDDGKGIDAAAVRKKAIDKGLISAENAAQMSDSDIIFMIFEPGFSTLDSVTSMSGRGVGMDVVKKALDSVGGHISVETAPGAGSKFSLSMPSSMAVKGTLLFELDRETYAIPLAYTEAVVSLHKPDIRRVGSGLTSSYLGKAIAVVFVKDLLTLKASESVYDKKTLHQSFNLLHPEKKLDMVIVAYNGHTIGFVVDKLLQQKEIVEKPLKKPVDHVKIISGVTIMGNGHVCLVFNVPEICHIIFGKSVSTKNTMSN